MLTEVLNEPDYIHIPFASWNDIYNTVVDKGLIGIPITILFHYKKIVQSEVLVGISPVSQNTKFSIAFEGYSQQQRSLEDTNADYKEDNNAFHMLSDTHQQQLMKHLHEVGLLGQEVNVFCKVNNSVNEVIKIAYKEHDDNAHHTIFIYRRNIREVAYVIVDNNMIEEIEDLLKLEPVNVFIRRI